MGTIAIPNKALINVQVSKGNNSNPNRSIEIKVYSKAIALKIKMQLRAISKILPEGSINFFVENDLTFTIKLRQIIEKITR